ncbi:MAG: hypothetical protein PHF86_10575 [Candidatus Nanoarchaeia archaeon]|jgi:hypothetical protein|nr:hypothetical protein [Candidatus Nanoarchaeia archaeon]
MKKDERIVEDLRQNYLKNYIDMCANTELRLARIGIKSAMQTMVKYTLTLEELNELVEKHFLSEKGSDRGI